MKTPAPTLSRPLSASGLLTRVYSTSESESSFAVSLNIALMCHFCDRRQVESGVWGPGSCSRGGALVVADKAFLELRRCF